MAQMALFIELNPVPVARLGEEQFVFRLAEGRLLAGRNIVGFMLHKSEGDIIWPRGVGHR